MERFQALVDEIVRQAASADERTAKAIKGADYVELAVDTLDGGNIVGPAQYQLDQANAAFENAAGLHGKLLEDADSGLEKVMRAEHGADEVFVGLVEGLFNQLVMQPLKLGAAIGGCMVGDPESQRQISELEQNLVDNGLTAVTPR